MKILVRAIAGALLINCAALAPAADAKLIPTDFEFRSGRASNESVLEVAGLLGYAGFPAEKTITGFVPESSDLYQTGLPCEVKFSEVGSLSSRGRGRLAVDISISGKPIMYSTYRVGASEVSGQASALIIRSNVFNSGSKYNVLVVEADTYSIINPNESVSCQIVE
jgi:hypothetical protein